MQSVSVKFDEQVLKNIDESIKNHNYNSRTEFIRDAIRSKLDELEKRKLIKEFLSLTGTAETKTSGEEDRLIREKVSKELLSELENKFK